MNERQKTISVIIPVFAANNSLKDYIIEISDTISKSKKINEMNYFLNKIILVDDGSPTNTHKVVKSLEENKVIQTIYLSKNYGQHAAIFAGVLSSTEDLIITMDEDGEHNPEAIEVMIERIEKENFDIIYASFFHSSFDLRELLSKMAKKFIAQVSRDKSIEKISSFRAVRGHIFRSAAVYANNGSFLDVALGWISKNVSTVKTSKRSSSRKSTYNIRGLISHFNSLFFAAGIKPLIFLFNIGWMTSLASLVIILVIIYRKIVSDIEVQGWVSSISVILFIGGIIISSIGLMARYLSTIVETSSGKPFFTIKK
jgi:undecaprenyl-phosphate 4-deoxy-4-formamido-L-arabinose transferase